MPACKPVYKPSKAFVFVALVGLIAGLSGCAPEVGSPRWCEAMAEKPKGDWTANEALDYAEHCLID